VRFKTQQSRRVWKHRTRIGLREAFAAQHVKKDLCMAATHISICLALGRLIAEIPPSIDDLLGRPSAKAKLQAPP
jgi:hypothetical protein